MPASVPTSENVKEKAKVLRQFLKEKCGAEVSHSHCIEAISKLFGFKDWNTASAVLQPKKAQNNFLDEIRTVGEMRAALAPYQDSDSLDADYEFKLGDLLDDCEDYSLEDSFHQEFRFSLPKQDNSVDGHAIVGLKLHLEHESCGPDFTVASEESCDYWKKENSDEP